MSRPAAPKPHAPGHRTAMYRLQFEPAQDCWVLLYPEGMVKLNASAAEILRALRRRDAPSSELVAGLERAFNADRRCAPMCCAFLVDAHERGWLA